MTVAAGFATIRTRAVAWPRDALAVHRGATRRSEKYMQHFPYPSYLRTHRKQWALSRKQLGLLLGVRAPSVVSRYELLVRTPPLHVVIGSEFIFGKPAREIFPALYAGVELNVVGRAALLAEQIAGREDKDAKTIGELLDAIVARSVSDQTRYMKYQDLPHRNAALAVFPTVSGFSWMLFDGPLSPVDWSGSSFAKRTQGDTKKNAGVLAGVQKVLTQYRPHTLVLEEFDSPASRRYPRIRALLSRSIVSLSRCGGRGGECDLEGAHTRLLCQLRC